MNVDELVDVVDEHGRVLSRARRAEVRRLNLRHRSAYVLVFNSERKLFIHRRTLTKDIYPGYWDVAIGGVLLSGEDYGAAAVRELSEELGLVVAALEPLFPFRFEDDQNRVLGHVYRCHSDGPFVLQTSEILEGHWMEMEDVAVRLAEESFCPDGAEVFRLFLSQQAAPRTSLTSRP